MQSRPMTKRKRKHLNTEATEKGSLPDIQQQSAVDRFNKWIAAAPGLKERLIATGMNPRSRSYTPAQVRLIVEVLQEP